MAYTLEELKTAVKKSYSYSETLRNMDRRITGSAHKYVKKKIIENNIDVSHFDKKRPTNNFNKKHWTEFLIHKNIKNRIEGKKLKRALMESGREYKCESCGIVNWQGKELLIQIHHIDGDWKNNLPENLQFLCPNCHSQTDNFLNKKTINNCIDCNVEIHKKSQRCNKCASKKSQFKNRKVKNRPSVEQLKREIEETSYCAVGRKYGVSDKAIRKWLIAD